MAIFNVGNRIIEPGTWPWGYQFDNITLAIGALEAMAPKRFYLPCMQTEGVNLANGVTSFEKFEDRMLNYDAPSIYTKEATFNGVDAVFDGYQRYSMGTGVYGSSPTVIVAINIKGLPGAVSSTSYPRILGYTEDHFALTGNEGTYLVKTTISGGVVRIYPIIKTEGFNVLQVGFGADQRFSFYDGVTRVYQSRSGTFSDNGTAYIGSQDSNYQNDFADIFAVMVFHREITDTEYLDITKNLLAIRENFQ
jgi:hypothetical protein